MQIILNGDNFELTEPIKQYVNEKFIKLGRFFSNIQEARVELGRITDHHRKGDVYFCEVNLSIPNEKIFIKKEADDIYKAIDEVKETAHTALENKKEKIRSIDRDVIRGHKAYQPADDTTG